MTIPDGDDLVTRPDVGRIFSAARRVRLSDASAGGRMRLDACARYLQDVANDDSRDAGTPNPTAWVARRTTLRVNSFPNYLDWVEMETWCSGIGPRWAERRYSIRARDASGSIDGATLWVHIDMTTMRAIPLPEGFTEQFGAAALGRRVAARLHLPNDPPDSATQAAEWPMRFTDFDILGHVNNAAYWAIVEEHLAARRDVRAPLAATIEHHNPIDPGDDVVVTVADGEAGFDVWVTTAAGTSAVMRVSATA